MVHAAALSEWALVSPFLVLATSCDISTGELHSVRGQGYNLTPAHTVYIRCTYTHMVAQSDILQSKFGSCQPVFKQSGLRPLS